jgi:hypothetical protein
MAINIPFIQDPTVITIIQTVLDIAGSNFQPPYSGTEQPYLAAAFNAETLLQYDQPGGTASRPTAETAISQGIGSAINALMTVLMPFISAYGLILPILGVIRGIIEVICAMMNPFAVIKAVIRLFAKWIPPFISLFPPLAGVIIIISTIKLILAIVFYIMTEVIPTLQLIKENIKAVKEGFNSKNESKKDAARAKIKKILILLANKSGAMAVLLPLLQIILLLLKLVAGFPCSKKKTRKAKGKRMDITKVPANFAELEDTSCCDDDVCPPEITVPPSSKDTGSALLLPAFFGDCYSIPGFAFKLFTNNSKVKKLRKYNNSLIDQLNAQLCPDQEINSVCPPGSDADDCPPFKVKITSRRGSGKSLTTNCTSISGSVITIVHPQARSMIGAVNYEIIPNYNILVMHNLIGLACHPDVAAAQEAAEPAEDMDIPLEAKFPLANDAIGASFNTANEINTQLAALNRVSDQIDDDANFPFDDQAAEIDRIQDSLIDTLNNHANQLTDALNSTLATASNRFNSLLEVDKNLAKANGQDIVTITVTPRDGAGADIAKNLPTGVSINVQLFTDFGVISNQRVDSANGVILADLTSTVPGTASVSAKINTEFISDRNVDGTESIRELQVRFVADAILPKRRKVSTPLKGGAQGTIVSPTGVDSEREPRK